MLNVNYTEFVNEEMSVISTKKLRDAMHDIIVDLATKETIDVEKMSEVLMDEYKITISPYFLDKFLDEFMKVKRGDRKAKTFFTKDDAKWLGVRDVNGTKEMRNNLLYLKPSLTKHKRRLFAEEDSKKLDDAYKNGMKDLSFSESVIQKTFVLQKPSDSSDIMKLIYKDIIFDKKYENTYDNCWKLTMLIGRQNKLDRRRGWWRLAPESVKKEYDKNQRINYDLTKPTKQSKPTKLIEPDLPEEAKNNLKIVDEFLNKYKNWGNFIGDASLRNIINLIDSLLSNSKSDDFNDFLSKIDELNLILIKYYRVDRKDVIMFYKNIGLAGYLREWETMKIRPKINTF